MLYNLKIKEQNQIFWCNKFFSLKKEKAARSFSFQINLKQSK